MGVRAPRRSLVGSRSARYRVAHELAHPLTHTVSGLVLAAPLEPAEHVEKLRSREPGNRSRSDIREQQVLERPDRLLQCLRGERLLREPLARDRLERIGGAGALGAPLGGGVFARLERCSELRAAIARGLERRRRVSAEAQHALAPPHLVTQSPETRVGARDEQVKPAAVTKLVRTCLRSRAADSRLGQKVGRRQSRTHRGLLVPAIVPTLELVPIVFRPRHRWMPVEVNGCMRCLFLSSFVSNASLYSVVSRGGSGAPGRS